MSDVSSSKLAAALDDLVTANRILATERIVDAFGHISCRHPERPDRFFMSRARAPNCVELDDLMEFDLACNPIDARGRMPYLERFIHGALYESRAEVKSVIHSHSHAIIPYGVTGAALRPITNQTAVIGSEVSAWDSRTRFGDTNMLVSNLEMGRDLARTAGNNLCCLMRGHGCVVASGSIRNAVYVAIALVQNAELQTASAALGEINFLTEGEVKLVNEMMDGLDDKPLGGRERAWEYWCVRAGMPYRGLA